MKYLLKHEYQEIKTRLRLSNASKNYNDGSVGQKSLREWLEMERLDQPITGMQPSSLQQSSYNSRNKKWKNGIKSYLGSPREMEFFECKLNHICHLLCQTQLIRSSTYTSAIASKQKKKQSSLYINLRLIKFPKKMVRS